MKMVRPARAVVSEAKAKKTFPRRSTTTKTKTASSYRAHLCKRFRKIELFLEVVSKDPLHWSGHLLFLSSAAAAASAPAFNIPTPVSGIKISSIVSGVFDDTGGGGGCLFSPNSKLARTQSSVAPVATPNPSISANILGGGGISTKRNARAAVTITSTAARAAASEKSTDYHDDFPSPAPYFEATFTKYQDFINVTIVSHFHHFSRCRSLLAALATALVRYFCRPPLS